MTLDEKTKYETVWRDCARYGKNWTDAGLGRPYKVPFLRGSKPGTVIDFGCGNGTSLRWLESQGYAPKGVEIASNAVSHAVVSVTICDLRDGQTLHPIGVAEYGLCTDLMEHIPTEDVDVVLRNISEHVSVGVLFGIARLPDKDGDALGLELHLTLKEKAWWDEKLLQHFSSVQLVRYDDGCYIVWGWK